MSLIVFIGMLAAPVIAYLIYHEKKFTPPANSPPTAISAIIITAKTLVIVPLIVAVNGIFMLLSMLGVLRPLSGDGAIGQLFAIAFFVIILTPLVYFAMIKKLKISRFILVTIYLLACLSWWLLLSRHLVNSYQQMPGDYAYNNRIQLVDKQTGFEFHNQAYYGNTVWYENRFVTNGKLYRAIKLKFEASAKEQDEYKFEISYNRNIEKNSYRQSFTHKLNEGKNPLQVEIALSPNCYFTMLEDHAGNDVANDNLRLVIKKRLPFYLTYANNGEAYVNVLEKNLLLNGLWAECIENPAAHNYKAM